MISRIYIGGGITSASKFGRKEMEKAGESKKDVRIFIRAGLRRVDNNKEHEEEEKIATKGMNAFEPKRRRCMRKGLHKSWSIKEFQPKGSGRATISIEEKSYNGIPQR